MKFRNPIVFSKTSPSEEERKAISKAKTKAAVAKAASATLDVAEIATFAPIYLIGKMFHATKTAFNAGNQ